MNTNHNAMSFMPGFKRLTIFIMLLEIPSTNDEKNV